MRRPHGHGMISTTARRRSATSSRDRGAALVIALVVMTVMAVVVAAVVTYATSSVMSTKSYRVQRDQRYGGDAAVKAAINWAENTTNVGRDPNNGLNDPACVLHLNAPVNGVNTDIKASCLADKDGLSGQPADVGLTPPEALDLLSSRTGEPGPYNAAQCSGWWDTFTGFFTQNNTVTQDAGKGMIPERSAFFKPRNGNNSFLGATCSTALNRTFQNFTINGDVSAASSIRVDNGSLTSVGGTIRARQNTQCSGTTCQPIGSRSGKTGVEAYLNGTAQDSDPGRSTPNTPAQNPQGNTAAPWTAVGFDANGNVKAKDASGNLTTSLPVQTTAYKFDPATSTADVPISDCGGTSTTVVFKPGWYTDANVLNRYTRDSANCKNVTFWFAPNPGPDGKLLTSDDQTGGFYFDFRATSGGGRTCGPGDSVQSTTRWCIGGSSDFNARVTVGTPSGWTPQGAFSPGPGGSDTRPRTAVVLGTAGTVDQDLSQSWANGAAAAAIDTNLAKYSPTGCVIWCFSSDRAIRVRNFSPKVTGPPLDVPGAPRGRIYLKVNYGVQGWQYADAATAQVQAVSADSGQKDCGTYTLFGNTSGGTTNKSQAAYTGTGTIPSYTFTDAQATQLANTCGTVDLINGFEVKVSVTGNPLNNGNNNIFTASSEAGKTYWWLDGVQLSYDSFAGANFPNPTGTGSTSADAAAKSDCDPTKAGGQLIFGGDSHVMIADGSMEVCAGPYPTTTTGDSAENHQSIGIYAMPSVAEVGPTGSLSKGGNTNSLGNTGGISAIDANPVQINYGSGCFACSNLDAWVDVGMKGYTPPTGYRIQKITARVGYNPKNTLCTGLFGCPGNAPQLQTPGGSNCNATNDYPKHSDQRMQVADLTDKTVLYDASTGRNCLNVAANGASLPTGNVRWHARAAFCGYIIAPCSGYTDELDGIQYQVSLAPVGTDAKLLPQTGCVVAHPNYNDGSDQPDCALIRASEADPTDNFTLPWNSAEAKWTGRISVKGTIYAPSSPIEVDDTDDAYPLATRGAVLRTLRVTGFGHRANYNGPAIDNTVNRTPKAREATFTSCIQNNAISAPTSPCKPPSAPNLKDGDTILTRARVRFDIDPTAPPASSARVPTVIWWSQDK